MTSFVTHLRTGAMSVLATLLALAGFSVLSGHVFASLAVEAQVSMWQKVDTFMADMTPGSQAQMRAYKSWLMQQRGEVKLQYIPISNLTVDVNPLDGVLRIYAIFLKKQGTATDAWYKIFDDASDDATAGDAMIAIPLLEASKEALVTFPDGFPLATGLVHGSYTAFIGANNVTPTTTGDGPNGFVLVGA